MLQGFARGKGLKEHPRGCTLNIVLPAALFFLFYSAKKGGDKDH